MKMETTVHTPCCAYCLHLMDGADSVKRCRVDRQALPVSRELEADCILYVRCTASDDAVPVWYWKAD